jgi:hypothetical protein
MSCKLRLLFRDVVFAFELISVGIPRALVIHVPISVILLRELGMSRCGGALDREGANCVSPIAGKLEILH